MLEPPEPVLQLYGTGVRRRCGGVGGGVGVGGGDGGGVGGGGGGGGGDGGGGGGGGDVHPHSKFDQPRRKERKQLNFGFQRK